MCVDAVAAGVASSRVEASRRAMRAALRPRPRRTSPPLTKMCSAESSADHLRDDIGQLAAVGDAIDERQVLGANRRPVDAVHVAVVEVVALEPPRLDEHLPPFVARIEAERPLLQAARPDFAMLGRRFGAPRRRRRSLSPCAPSASCGRATARSSARRPGTSSASGSCCRSAAS